MTRIIFNGPPVPDFTSRRQIGFSHIPYPLSFHLGRWREYRPCFTYYIGIVPSLDFIKKTDSVDGIGTLCRYRKRNSTGEKYRGIAVEYGNLFIGMYGRRQQKDRYYQYYRNQSFNYFSSPTFDLRYAVMNSSISPSRTAVVLLVSYSVRWSFTSLYGCRI